MGNNDTCNYYITETSLNIRKKTSKAYAYLPYTYLNYNLLIIETICCETICVIYPGKRSIF